MSEEKQYTKRAKRLPGQPARCSHCKVLKGPENYHTNKYGTLNSWCRDCHRDASRKHWRKYYMTTKPRLED